MKRRPVLRYVAFPFISGVGADRCGGGIAPVPIHLEADGRGEGGYHCLALRVALHSVGVSDWFFESNCLVFRECKVSHPPGKQWYGKEVKLGFGDTGLQLVSSLLGMP